MPEQDRARSGRAAQLPGLYACLVAQVQITGLSLPFAFTAAPPTRSVSETASAMLAPPAASRGRALTGPEPDRSSAWSGRVSCSGWNLAVPTVRFVCALIASNVAYGCELRPPGR